MRKIFFLLIFNTLYLTLSAQVFFEENFNSGLPAGFQIQNGGSSDLTWEVVPFYTEGTANRSLNGSQFLFCNGDPAGPNSTMDDFITTPVINTSTASQLFLQFSQFYRDYAQTDSDTGIIDVFDGNDWVRVASNVGNKGSWTTPLSTRINISAYKNADMKIRFRFVGVWPWYWAIDNLKVFVPQPNDVGVSSVTSPLNDCNLGTSLTLKVKVANYGTASQPGVPVFYSVNGGTPVSQTMSSSIPTNSTRDLSFTTPISLATTGLYKVKIWTGLATDADRSNDTLTISFTKYTNSIPPVPFTSYDGTNLSEVADGWYETRGRIPSGTVSAWTRCSQQQEVVFGSRTAKINLNGNLLKEYMVSPAFRPEPTTGVVFKLALTSWQGVEQAFMGSDDSVKVLVSTNCGISWKSLVNFHVNSGLTNQLVKFTVPLALYANQEIKLAFYATDGAVNNEEDYDIHVDDIEIVNLAPVDIGVIQIKSPVSNCGLGNSPVTISIRNFGAQTQRNFNVSYNFNNGTPVTELFTDSIRPNQIKDYTFNQLAGISPVGIYKFASWTGISGDAQAFNDSVKNYQVENSLAISNFPYLEGFENGSGGWKSGGTLSSWALGTPQKSIINSPGEGSVSWVTGGLGTATYNTLERSFVASPCFNFTNLVNPVFEARIWWHTEFAKDGALLQYSTNGGINWRNVGLLNDPNNWYNTETIPALSFIPQVVPQTGWSGGVGTSTAGSGGWVSVRNFVKLAAGISQVRFRIVFASDASTNGDGFAFDRVSIYEGPSKDVEMLEISNPLLSNCAFGPNFPIKVKIKNKGLLPATGIPVSYSVNNQTPVTETITASVDTSQTFEYTFNQTYNFSTPGIYKINVWSALPGDNITNNDSIFNHTVAVYSNGLDTLKLNGYNGSNISRIYPGWREAKRFTPIGQVSNWTGSNLAQILFFNSPTAKLNLFGNVNKEWLISPQFSCEPTTRLSFRIALTKTNDITLGRLGSDDSVVVKVSTNCGLTWTNLKYFNKDSVLNQNFRTIRINLGAFAGQKIIIGFYGSDGAIDDPQDSDVHIDKVLVLPSPANDMAMAGLVSPTSPCGLGAAEQIKVKIINNGGVSQSSYSVGYRVNGGAPVIQNFTTNLASGQESVVTFNQTFNFSLPGIYVVKMWTILAGDAVTANDSSSFIIRKYGLPAPILNFNGYGGTNLPSVSNDWSEGKGDTLVVMDSDWNALALGSNTVARINLAGLRKKNWIISPVIKTGIGTRLLFKAALRIPNTNFDGIFDLDDRIKILITNNCGLTWVPLKIYSDTSLPALTASLEEQIVDMSSFDNQEVRIAFFADAGVRADAVSDFLLDDIRFGSTPSSISQPVLVDYNFANAVICEKSTLKIKFDYGQFVPGNTFKVEVSPDGSFSPASTIELLGSLSLSGNGQNQIISVNFPADIPAGNNYRLRVKGDNPLTYSAQLNAFPFTVSKFSQSDPDAYPTGYWKGSFYQWTPSTTAVITNANTEDIFNALNYRGYITEDSLSFDYDWGTDISAPGNLPDTNKVCGVYKDFFSIRMRRRINFEAGYYVFGGGASDGFRLSIDGGATWIIDDWKDHDFRGSLNNNGCGVLIPAGFKDVVVEFYDNKTEARFKLIIVKTGDPSVGTVSITFPTNGASICAAAAPFQMTANPPGAFQWSGVGVSPGGILNPQIGAGGPRIITYQTGFQAFGQNCLKTATVTVNILPGASAQFSGLDTSYCTNASPVTLLAQNPGGVFSGPGVSGTTFNPALAGPGLHTIRHILNGGTGGCIDTVSKVVRVYLSTPVSIQNSISSICQTAAPVQLIGLPAGGVFAGTGVVNSVFFPNLVSGGSTVISYSLVNGICSNQTQINVAVLPAISAQFSGLDTSYCSNASTVTLVPQNTGGSFSGPGVSLNIFNPSVAGPGLHTIRHIISSQPGGCNPDTVAKKVRVYLFTPVSIQNSISTICQTADSILLVGTPAGGAFSGPGVLNNIFYPNLASPGNTIISYELINGSCTNQTQINFTVRAAKSARFSGLDSQYCSTAQPVTLVPQNPGGVFSGSGITGNVFSPQALSTGQYFVTHILNTPGGCIDTVRGRVQVTVPVQPSIVLPAQLCSSANPIALTANVPGVFTGPGVAGNLFDPSLAGIGSNSIVFTSVQGACELVSNYSINVFFQENAVLSIPDSSFCIGQAAKLKISFSPAGGLLTGTGIIGDSLFISGFSQGQYVLQYTTESGGCKDTASVNYNIYGLPDPGFADLPDTLCSSAADIPLSPVVPGGIFSGPGISPDGNFFQPSQVPVNQTSKFKYTVSVNGCSNERMDSISVIATPRPELGPDTTIEAGFSITLDPKVSGPYTWLTLPASVNPAPSVPLTISTDKNLMVYVSASDPSGSCTARDSIQILVRPADLPTLITINGDGVNDFFEVKGSNNALMRVSIFDRWGKKVHSDVFSDGIAWRPPGDVRPGVYFYTITNFADGRTWGGWLFVSKD